MAVSLLSTTAFAMQCLNESDGNGGYKYIDSTSGALKGHEDENGNTSYDYYLSGDLELNKTLVVNGEDVNASLELNGHTLCLNAPGTLTATKQTLSDGWNYFVPVPAEGQDSIKKGAIVLVSNGAEFTVTDSTAEFERDETTGEITGVISYGTGTISGGTGVCGWSPYKGQDINPDNGEGGGVHVYKNGVFNMVGGNIKNNHTAAHGGGLASWYGGEINLTGVCVSENTTRKILITMLAKLRFVMQEKLLMKQTAIQAILTARIAVL